MSITIPNVEWIVDEVHVSRKTSRESRPNDVRVRLGLSYGYKDRNPGAPHYTEDGVACNGEGVELWLEKFAPKEYSATYNQCVDFLVAINTPESIENGVPHYCKYRPEWASPGQIVGFDDIKLGDFYLFALWAFETGRWVF